MDSKTINKNTSAYSSNSSHVEHLGLQALESNSPRTVLSCAYYMVQACRVHGRQVLHLLINCYMNMRSGLLVILMVKVSNLKR